MVYLHRLTFAIGGPIFFIAGSFHRIMIVASGLEKHIGDTVNAMRRANHIKGPEHWLRPIMQAELQSDQPTCSARHECSSQ